MSESDIITKTGLEWSDVETAKIWLTRSYSKFWSVKELPSASSDKYDPVNQPVTAVYCPGSNKFLLTTEEDTQRYVNAYSSGSPIGLIISSELGDTEYSSVTPTAQAQTGLSLDNLIEYADNRIGANNYNHAWYLRVVFGYSASKGKHRPTEYTGMTATKEQAELGVRFLELCKTVMGAHKRTKPFGQTFVNRFNRMGYITLNFLDKYEKAVIAIQQEQGRLNVSSNASRFVEDVYHIVIRNDNPPAPQKNTQNPNQSVMFGQI